MSRKQGMSRGSSCPSTACSAMCWWSTGTDGVNAPTMADTCGAQIPQALTTCSAAIRPPLVSTARTARRSSSSIPVTRVFCSTTAPSSRAASASACVAVCGSTQPSCSIQIAPYRSSRLACGIRSSASSGDSTCTSRPMPRARLAPRSSSTRLSGLEAIRRLPSRSNTPSRSYSSTL